MKHATLHSIAHNLGDSLASGIGLMIGVYDLDIYTLAKRAENRRISLDMLAGEVIEGTLDAKHLDAFDRYRTALPQLAASQGANLSDFKVLVLSFWVGEHFGMGLDVDVADNSGKRSTRSYRGMPARIPTVLDDLGRRRKLKPKRTG